MATWVQAVAAEVVSPKERRKRDVIQIQQDLFLCTKLRTSASS